ncbi:MAG: hypothetical protein QG673_1429 [Pseudomonadota bacterium]|nr:hypothetical protein [Pseudomonadota bacterium]
MYSTSPALPLVPSPRRILPSSPDSSSQSAAQTDGLFNAGINQQEKAEEKPNVKFSLAEVRKQIRVLRAPASSSLHRQALAILNEFVKNEQPPKDNVGISDVRSCIRNFGSVKLWMSISNNSSLMESQEYKSLVISFLADIARVPQNHIQFFQEKAICLLISLLANLPLEERSTAISNMLRMVRGYSYGWKVIDETAVSDEDGNWSVSADSIAIVDEKQQKQLKFNFTTPGHIIGLRTGDGSECNYLEFVEEVNEVGNRRFYEFRRLSLSDKNKNKQPDEIAQLFDQTISKAEIFTGDSPEDEMFTGDSPEKSLPKVALQPLEDTIKRLIGLLTETLDDAKILASTLLAHLTSSPENCARVIAHKDCFRRLVKLLDNESCREHVLITLFQLYQHNRHNLEAISTETIRRVGALKALQEFVKVLQDAESSTDHKNIVAEIILNIVIKIKGEGFTLVANVIGIPALVDMLGECVMFPKRGELAVRTLVYFAKNYHAGENVHHDQMVEEWDLDRWIRLLVNNDIPQVIKQEAAKVPAHMYAQQLSNVVLCSYSGTTTAQVVNISQEDALNALSQLSNNDYNCACLHELMPILNLVNILHSNNPDTYKNYASKMLTNLTKTATLAMLNPIEVLPVGELETDQPLVGINNKVLLDDWVNYLGKEYLQVLKETAIVAVGILISDAECQQNLVYYGVIRQLVLCVEDTSLKRDNVLLILRQLATNNENLVAFANAEVGVVLKAFLEFCCDAQLHDSVKELFRALSNIIMYDEGLGTQYNDFGGCADDLFSNGYKVAAAMELMMWMRMAGKLYHQGENSPVFSQIRNKYDEYIEIGNLIAWGKVVCRLTARLTGIGRDREKIAEAIAFLSRHPRIQSVMKKNGIVSHLLAILKDENSSPKIKEYIGEAVRNIGSKKNQRDAVIATSLYRNEEPHNDKSYNNEHKESTDGVTVYNVIATPDAPPPPDSKEENGAIVSSLPSDGYYKGSHDRATQNFYNKKPGADSVTAVATPKPNKPGKSNPIPINGGNTDARRHAVVVGSAFNEKYFDNRNSAPTMRTGVNNTQFRQRYQKEHGLLEMDKNGKTKLRKT